MQERHTAQLLSPDTHAPWQATHGAGIAHLWHTLPCIVVSIETMEATERCGYSESLMRQPVAVPRKIDCPELFSGGHSRWNVS